MSDSNVIRETVNVSDLVHGNTVEVDGHMKTVHRNQIRHDPLFGWTYDGAPYPRGITKIVFKVPTAYGFRYEGR